MTRDHRARLRRAAAVSAGLSIAAGPVGLLSLVAAPSAAAATASSTCTPQAPYAHCVRFSFTGSDQSFTVPKGVSTIRALLWGAGGGGAYIGQPQYTAGGGGYTVGTIKLKPGAQLTVSVGQGGNASGVGYSQNVYGGGGLGGNGTNTGGSGGGMSALWWGPYGTTPLLIAGAGGGASPGSQTSQTGGQYPGAVFGGSGGGYSGGSDNSGFSGGGGDQTGGGDPGVPPVPCDGSGSGGTAPTVGLQYTGGNGAGSDPSPPGVGQTAEGGGGGGGGYYGGGGGRCNVYVTDQPSGAGGGGSSYIDTSGITHAATYGGENGNYYGTGKGAPPAKQAMSSPYYLAGIGWGGGKSGRTDGGNGQVVIEWGRKSHPKPTPKPSPSPAPPPPGHHSLPITGFPFAQVGIAAMALIGLGAMAARAGRPRRQL
jgi:hypothetical protein